MRAGRVGRHLCRSAANLDITPSDSYDADMHRTTINLDEGIYRRVIDLASRRGESMARTIESLLRAALASDEPRPELPLHRDNGPRPGVDIADRHQLYDLMGDE